MGHLRTDYSQHTAHTPGHTNPTVFRMTNIVLICLCLLNSSISIRFVRKVIPALHPQSGPADTTPGQPQTVRATCVPDLTALSPQFSGRSKNSSRPFRCCDVWKSLQCTGRIARENELSLKQKTRDILRAPPERCH